MDDAQPTRDLPPGATTERRTFRYRAFLSYSHRDEKSAAWLHRALENYAVPRPLIGTEGRDGPIPRRIIPVFRDRDELPASADLGLTLRQALADSAVVVVLCSPDAARSHWVNEEIMEFKRAGRAGRVLALIVRGTPHNPDDECFPAALRFHVGENGHLTSDLAEPIAADFRAGADGAERAKLKIIAGVLGVPFDLLYARERRRKKRRRTLAVLAVLLLAAAFAGLWEWGQIRIARQKHESEQKLAREAEEREIQKRRFEAADKAEEGRQALLAGDAYAAEPALRRSQETWPEDGTKLMLAAAQNELSGLKAVWPDHAGGILRLYTSRDGRRALSIGEEGTAIVWDAAAGALLHRIGQPAGQANGFAQGAFSPDGRWVVVTRSFGSEAVLLDLTSGKQRSFPNISAALFIADGRLAVLIRDYKTPGRFGWIDPESGAETDAPVLPIPCEYLEAADVEGHTAVFSARVDRNTRHGWVDLATGAMIADLPDERTNDDGPVLSPDGSRLAIATKQGFQIRSRQDVIGTLVASQPVNGQSLLTASIIPFRVRWAGGGHFLVSMNQGGTCSVWDADGKWLRTWPVGGMPEMEVDPEGTTAAFTTDAGYIEIRDIESAKVLAAFSDTIGRRKMRDMTSARTASVHFLPKSAQLLSAWESHEVKVWSWKKAHSAVHIAHEHEFGISSLAWSADGGTLASSGKDGRVVLWDPRSGNPAGEIRVSDKPGLGVAGAAFGPGDVVFTVDSNGLPGAWQRSGKSAVLEPAEPERKIETPAQFQSSMADLQAVAGDPASLGGLPPVIVGQYLLTAARNQRAVRVRDLPSHTFTESLATSGGRLREFTTLGKLALLADDAGVVTGVKLTDGKQVFSVKASDKPLRVIRAGMGSRFATVDKDGRAAIFSADGQPLAKIVLEKIRVNDVLLGTDPNSIYLACDDGKVRPRPVWDTALIKEWSDSAPPPHEGMPSMPTFGDARQGVVSLALTNDGRYLAGSQSTGAVCLWETSTGRLLYRFPFEQSDALAFSPDSHWLAAGGTNGCVALLRLSAP
jgi:WD40 repeat protein